MSPMAILGALFAFLAIGMPIFLVLGFIALILFTLEGMPLVGVAQLVPDNLNSIALTAIPFFVMAASFMQRGGIAKALVDAAYAWVGWAQGGLAIVCVLATTVFAAISGSSVATALAMGTILVPAMLDKGYERPFALGVVGASGTLGILIPPSLAMIIYAIVAEESVPRLFLAGVIPGLLQAVLFAIWITIYTRRRPHLYPKEARVSRGAFLKANRDALPALLIPVVVLGGIYGGFVTVTEAAALSAFVSIIASVFFYRGCSLAEVVPIIAESIKTTASIIFIVIGALMFGHWITSSGVPNALVDFVTDRDLEAWHFLLFANVMMLVLGMFLEVIAVILITVPLLLPLLQQLQIDTIHYAIIVTVNMELALLTPPIGLNLYVLSSISKAPIGEVIKGVWPFIVIMLGLLALVTYVPELSTWLPEYVYGSGQSG